MDNAKPFRRITLRDRKMSVNSTPLSKETEDDRDTDVDLAVAAYIDEISTLELPALNIDRLATQVNLRDVVMPSLWSSPLTDDISIYNQPTWFLPVMPGFPSNRVSRQASPSAKQASDSETSFGLIRNLVKKSGIYAISSLTGPLVGLLLAPYLTHTLSRSEYGALVVLNTAVVLVTGVSQLGLGSAFTRLYSFDCKTQREQLDALSTLVVLLLLILIPITTVGVMAAPWLAVLVLGSASYTSVVAVASVLVLSQNLTVPGLVWLRVESRAVLFSTISIANLLITAGANIVLVGILHMGIVGSLVANGLGDVIIIICTLPVIFWRAGLHMRFAMATSMLAFGVPHNVNLISGWVLQLSDRYLLEHFASLSLAAGYSVAYALGGILSSAINVPFELAWWVLIYHIAKREDAKLVFKLIFRGYSFVLLFATLGLSLFGSSVLDLLFPVSYHTQSSIIPIIALSTMFNGILIVISLGIVLQRKNWLASINFIFSALINVGLNILLIPTYGTMGAALATLVAYITLAIIAYLFNQRIYPIPFEVGLFLVAMGIGFAFYFLDIGLVHGQSTMVVWGIHIGAVLLYGLCLLLIGWHSLIARKIYSLPYTKRLNKGL